MSQPIIAKVENGKREVTVNELFWFALALDVSPLALCFRRDGGARIAPATDVSVSRAWAWVRGFHSITPGETQSRPTGSRANLIRPASRFYFEQVTDDEAAVLRDFPYVTNLWRYASAAMETAGQAALATDKKARRRHLRALFEDLERLKEHADADIRIARLEFEKGASR